MFELLQTEGKARRGVFTCAHGTVQTPVFMNVGTQGAIKGALSAKDLKDIGCQVELSNTYHLHLRPGDELVKQCGGLHKFMKQQKKTASFTITKAYRIPKRLLLTSRKLKKL